MEKLSVNKNAFIRPSPSSGHLEGLQKGLESILCLEEAGFDIILLKQWVLDKLKQKFTIW